jgi:hypothetical protein
MTAALIFYPLITFVIGVVIGDMNAKKEEKKVG